MARSKITIDFKAKQTHLRIKNCTPEQVIMGLKLYELQAEKDADYVRPESAREKLKEMIVCLELLLVAPEHPDSFHAENAAKLLPLGVRQLVDYYKNYI